MKWAVKPWKRLFNDRREFAGYIKSPRHMMCECGKPGEYLCEYAIAGDEVCQKTLCRDCVVDGTFCKEHAEQDRMLGIDVFGD